AHLDVPRARGGGRVAAQAARIRRKDLRAGRERDLQPRERPADGREHRRGQPPFPDGERDRAAAGLAGEHQRSARRRRRGLDADRQRLLRHRRAARAPGGEQRQREDRCGSAHGKTVAARARATAQSAAGSGSVGIVWVTAEAAAARSTAFNCLRRCRPTTTASKMPPAEQIASTSAEREKPAASASEADAPLFSWLTVTEL